MQATSSVVLLSCSLKNTNKLLLSESVEFLSLYLNIVAIILGVGGTTWDIIQGTPLEGT